MAEKILNTRLRLKYDTYANWKSNNPVLLAGEVAIATVPTGDTNDVSTSLPAVVMKVGNGTDNYLTLPLLSAKAADVHSWAKAEDKPTYEAKEITGISDYIAEYVETEMGISVDTDTQYQIVKVDDYNYKLQSKGKGDSAWADVANGAIVIPKYDDTQVKADIKAVSDLVGTTAVASQIANAISALNLADTYAAKDHDHVAADITDFATEVAKVEVENAVTAKNAVDALHADSASKVDSALTVKVGGADVVFDGSSAKTADVDAAIQNAIDALPEQTDYTVTITENTEDTSVAKTYVFTQNGAEIGSIKLAKELVVTAGSVKEVTEAGVPYTGAVVGDKYIELVIANQDTPIYVPAKDLVDIYTAAPGAAEVQVAISNTNEISATLTDSVKEKLNKAHTHTFKDSDVEDAIAKKHSHTFVESELNKIAEGDVAKWNAAEQNAKDYTDEEIEKLALGTMSKESADDYAKKDVALGDVVFGHTDGDSTDGDPSEDVEMLQYTLNDASGTFKKGSTIQTARILKADTGLKVTKSESNGVAYNTVGLDESVTFVFNCGNSQVSTDNEFIDA